MKSFNVTSKKVNKRANAAIQRVTQPTKILVDNRPLMVAQRKLQTNISQLFQPSLQQAKYVHNNFRTFA